MSKKKQIISIHNILFLVTHKPHRKISRPKAWTWTRRMELDLINYQKKYKIDKISDNAVFMKISRKFVVKGYANISRKSIKYKYEKLQATGQIKELEEEAKLNLVESDDEDAELKKIEKKSLTKKKFSTWNQEMEILLLNLVDKLRNESPAMSDNSIFRKITFYLQKEGFTNLTEHIVLYHYRKLKQNVHKFQRLTKLSKEFDGMPCDKWTKSSESMMMHYYNKIKQRMPILKPMDLYAEVKNQLEGAGCGNFSEASIRYHYLGMFNCEDGLGLPDANDYQKRNYLYWTEEMKEALLRYHKILKQRPGITELWENVAKMMREDGFGDFTSDNVKYKYFNLKRKNNSTVMVEDFEQAEV